MKWATDAFRCISGSIQPCGIDFPWLDVHKDTDISNISQHFVPTDGKQRKLILTLKNLSDTILMYFDMSF